MVGASYIEKMEICEINQPSSFGRERVAMLNSSNPTTLCHRRPETRMGDEGEERWEGDRGFLGVGKKWENGGLLIGGSFRFLSILVAFSYLLVHSLFPPFQFF